MLLPREEMRRTGEGRGRPRPIPRRVYFVAAEGGGLAEGHGFEEVGARRDFFQAAVVLPVSGFEKRAWSYPEVRRYADTKLPALELANLDINEDFQKLIPPLTDEEYSSLEESLLNEGCRDSLIVWREIIVDGHTRYKICQKHGIEFKIKEIKFEDEDEAKVWIINNQFSRRNLSAYDKSVLALKLKEIIAAREKEKIVSGQFGKRDSKGNMAAPDLAQPRNRERNTAYDLARKAGVGHTTLHKVETIEKTAPKEVKEQIRKGEVSIDSAYKGIKQSERREQVKKEFEEKGQVEFPKGKFQIIYADPPWEYEGTETESRAIDNQYTTMKLKDIQELTDGERTVKDLSAKDSVLFLWVTFPKLEAGLSVLKEWGFRYVTGAVWDKQKIGMGYYFRGQTELLLVGKKGSLPLPEERNRVSNLISEKRTAHSRKPDKVYETIEKMYPDATKVELFSRSERKGWSMWGK